VTSILRHVIAVGESSFTLCIRARGPPLSLFDMLLAKRGREFKNLMFLGGLPSLGRSFVFLDGVLPFQSLYSPLLFFGCFDLFMIGRVSYHFSIFGA
jgi:hypothetical protein